MTPGVETGEGPPLVIAIVLNWNNLPDTLECVESLRRSDYGNVRVWVVDNDSRQNPASVLGQDHPGVRVIRNSHNLGYGAGNNVGLRQAIREGAQYVVLVNNDVVMGHDTIRRLVAAMQANGKIAMATPRVFYYDRPEEVYWDGGTVDWETGHTPHDSRNLPADSHIVKSEWLDGCVLMVRVSAIPAIGMLDERYFLYFEDTEWSIRASRAGWINAVVFEAHAWHKVSRSTGGIANPAVRFYYLRNRYLFMSAHRRSGAPVFWKTRYLSEIAWQYVSMRHEREPRQAVLAAFLSVIRGRWGPYQTAGRERHVVLAVDRLVIGTAKGLRPLMRLMRRSIRLGRRLTGGRGAA
jgi:hypothetical protein